ncbi:Cystathionine, variant 2 [Perkinsus olseni]|uniref:plant cystathionine gamma-synthase n=1 Tax=Perkinsus olseni TaxID=32597 RepID=A0A7J6MCX6_PEROL|nr:Cystathionine, variant 2 [Perkinsus olseni]
MSSNGNTVAGEWIPGPLGMGTELVHASVSPDNETGAILTPVFLSTTFVQESVDKYLAKASEHYSRTSNPTVRAYEEKIAELEKAPGGAAVFGTGMAATTTVVCGLMKTGDHAVVTECSYGGTNRIMREQFIPLGMEFSFVDMTDIENIKKAIKPNTKMIFSETPTNPLLRLVDLEAVSALCREKGIVHVCDSTFATPVICRPMDFGVDITLQSTTKYYDGHNITTGGALACRTKELYQRMKFVQNMHGNIMSPFVAFIQMQTVKTLELRIQRQSETAMKICKFLEGHPKCSRVIYPGLKSHPQHELAKKLHRNNLHGGMLWFDVVGGSDSGTKLMNSIQRPWSLCENLGATESIITACAVMTHANMLPEDRLRLGIVDGFIRVSVGVEDADDLIRSLKDSLDRL